MTPKNNSEASIGSPPVGAPANQALHALLTSLEQLVSQATIVELGLARPIAELALALTEQRLELVAAQAQLRDLFRVSRFLVAALLAIDARHQRGASPLLPIGTVESLRTWLLESMARDQERDADHTPAPVGAGSVKQLQAGERDGVLNSDPRRTLGAAIGRQGRDDQHARADGDTPPAPQDA